MPVDGSVKLRAKANGINVSIDTLVSNAIQDEMLVSYKDLITLQIIPGGFPNTIIRKCREVTRIKPKGILLEEYPDVLSNKLSPEPMKTDAPMHIHIKEGATPKKSYNSETRSPEIRMQGRENSPRVNRKRGHCSRQRDNGLVQSSILRTQRRQNQSQACLLYTSPSPRD